jgi:hypothetical protein
LIDGRFSIQAVGSVKSRPEAMHRTRSMASVLGASFSGNGGDLVVNRRAGI